MQKGRKLSDFTCNSPSSQLKGSYFFNNRQEGLEGNQSGRTQKSKYSNSSKLTQSQLFEKLSKATRKEKLDSVLKERDVEIEILEDSLHGILHSQQAMVFQLGDMLGKYSELASQLAGEIASL